MPLTEDSAAERSYGDKAVQALKNLHPFRCLGEADDVSYEMLLLASDESRLVNGAHLVIDSAQFSTCAGCELFL